MHYNFTGIHPKNGHACNACQAYQDNRVMTACAKHRNQYHQSLMDESYGEDPDAWDELHKYFSTHWGEIMYRLNTE